MTKSTICEIFLNPNGHCNGVYHSGQKLTGNIVLTFYEKQTIKDIVIQVLGIGKCEWTEQKRLYAAEEVYLKSETRIFSAAEASAFKRTADGFVKILPGVYTYPFEVELSENLPTSCEGKFGFIRYLASVNIIRQMLPVETQTIAFTVIKPHNLNALPVYQVPTTRQQCVKFFGLLSLKLNNVTITATMPTSGYAPGQVIPLQVDVNNKSNRNISEFMIELNKVFVYYDKEKKHNKKHKIPLTAVYIKGCPANTCTIQMPEIIVPPVPATDIVSSKIIHITYELKIYGNFCGNTIKPLIKLPITIGTVPLYSTYRCVHFEDSTECNHIVPSKYEALIDDYLNLGNSVSSKNDKYAPVYPIFRVRLPKRKPNIEQNSDPSLDPTEIESRILEGNH